MADDSPEAFTAVVAAWTEKAKAAPLAVLREGIQDLNELIITTSPYKTGYLRGSYYAAIDQIPQGDGQAGRDSSAAVNLVAAQLQMGQTYIMGPTARYARRLEYGFVGQDSLGRTYNQAGRFWIAAALSQASAIFEAAAQRVGAGSGP